MLLQVITILTSGILSTIAGIGGGGLLLPIYLFLVGSPIDQSIPLTIITILGNCVVRFFYLWNKKIFNMNKRYLVDLLPTLIIVPFDGNVSFIGVYLSLIFPKIINLFCVIFVMMFLFTKTYFKYKKVIREENTRENIIHYIDGISLPIQNIHYIETNYGENSSERNRNLIYLFLCIFGISIFAFIINNLEFCSFDYSLLLISQLVIFGCISLYNCNLVIKTYKKRKENNFSFIPNDIKWNKKNTLKLGWFSTVTGILSTYLGIGGGMIMSPILLGMNMNPQVVASTLSLTTLFSSFISSLNYILVGKMPYEWSIIGFMIGMLSCFIGINISEIIIKKYKKQSVIILALLLIILVSTILLSYKGYTELENLDFTLKSLC